MLKNKIFSKFQLYFFAIIFIACSQKTAAIPLDFNNCQISLDTALEELKSIESNFAISLDIRIVRELTDRDECIDQVLGTNLEQGADLKDGSLIDLVVGIKKDEVTEYVKETELDLYLSQLEEKDLLDINLISASNFGTGKLEVLKEGLGVITHIEKNNNLGYSFIFSEASGKISGLNQNGEVVELLDISSKTIREREAGLHTFAFKSIEEKDYLIVTYSGIDGLYNLSAFEIESGVVIGDEIVISKLNLSADTNVHFGGKIFFNGNNLYFCTGDQNSPGNSAKLDTPWGKVIRIQNLNLLTKPIDFISDERVNFIAYGLRNPWSCFSQGNDLILLDVGNSHWEEVNIIENYDAVKEPIFFGWPWLESFFDANYKNTPVSNELKLQQIDNTKYPIYLYPHANDYCAIIGGTTIDKSNKWKDYFFVGDFCTGNIWAINYQKDIKLTVLERDIIPYSITTISDSNNETLLVGTTSGQILEIFLP